MFKYGKKAGIMSIVLAALAIIPLLAVMYFIPQLPESVPMEFSAGVATRFSNRYELLLVPGVRVPALHGHVYERRQAGPRARGGERVRVGGCSRPSATCATVS